MSETAASAAVLESPAAGRWLPAQAGMLAFLLSEVAFFSTLITTYIVFLRETKDSNPSPAQVFHLPLVLIGTACLLSSSATVHFAERAAHGARRGAFLGWWGLTILLGATFLACTGKEWSELIGRYGMTISRNLFGSCYFTLVGFHAAHVTVGLIVMTIVFALAWRKQIAADNTVGIQVVSWYWHFVDGVWVVVFSLVYLIGA